MERDYTGMELRVAQVSVVVIVFGGVFVEKGWSERDTGMGLR